MKFYIGSSLKNFKTVDYYTKVLKENNWEHTYNWVENIEKDEKFNDLANYAKCEKDAIEKSDVVIILLPAGRGTHVELGLALAYGKKVFLCAGDKEEFSIENTVALYELESVEKLVGTPEENLKKILKFKK